jgi:hypothetical protein
MATRSAVNPFYVVLVLVGVAFFLTASAYGVMAFRAVKSGATAADPEPGLAGFLDRHGAALLGGQVAVLAVATVGAIATDSFWTRRAAGAGRQREEAGP